MSLALCDSNKKMLHRGLGMMIASVLCVSCGTKSTVVTKPFTTPAGADTGTTQTQSSTGCDMDKPFSGGDGSLGNPFKLADACDFLILASADDSWSANYILTADWDMTGITSFRSIDFAGTIDGRGKLIKNFQGTQPLFGTNSGTIKNMNLPQVNMNLSAVSRSSPLVSTNSGTMSDCTVTGSITAVGFSAFFHGGIAGINSGTISHSSAVLSLSGNGGVGGLVGENQGSITTSHSGGSVSAGDSGVASGVGGFAGVNSATGIITDCYSTAAVVGISGVGGFVGSNNGTIGNSYATGLVTGTGVRIGGFTGSNSGSASNSFWDTTTSAQATSAAGSGKTTAEMAIEATFVGWDFVNKWVSPTTAYPTLR